MADYDKETAGLTSSRPKSSGRKWLWIGVPVAVVVILAAVPGGVLGSRAHKNSNDSTNGNAAAASSPTGEAAASQAASIKEQVGLFPTGTDSQYLLPIYPATVSPNSSELGRPPAPMCMSRS